MTLEDKIRLAEEAAKLSAEAHGQLSQAAESWKQACCRAVALKYEADANESALRAAILLESIAHDKRFTTLPKE